jgi:plastocyanin
VIEQIWNGILTWGSQFIIPDWGGLISLLPVFMLVIVILILARMVWMYATIGPRRVRRPRRPPVPPPGLHMPGPTYAPIFGAIGAFFLFLGLVFGGLWILVGLIALVLGLLYWGREALRDYDHVAETYPALVAPPPTTPPPGVHMPGPTFRPFVLALGLGFLFLGLVFPGWILLFGVVFTIVPLLGWLRDAGKEYGHTVEADRIGHVTNEPAPSWPRRLFWIMGILLVVAVIFTQGWFPPKSSTAEGGTAGGSPAPGGSPAAGGSPGASGGPAAGGITVVAKDVKFNTAKIDAPAAKAFTITFDNQDAGTPHDIDILDSTGKKVVDNKDFPGVATKTYDIPAIPAGTYKFECSIHPALMNGELVAGP